MDYNIGDYMINEHRISRVVSAKVKNHYKDSFDGGFITFLGSAIWYNLETIKYLTTVFESAPKIYTTTELALKLTNHQKLIPSKWLEFIYDVTF